MLGRGQVGWMPLFLGGEGGNGLPQWSQSRPCTHIDITRKPRPCACPVLTGGGELHLGNDLSLFISCGISSK